MTQKIEIATIVALPARDGWGSTAGKKQPRVTHELFKVLKLTETQAITQSNRQLGGDVRFRLSDLKVVGENYRYVHIATQELIDEIARQHAEVDRYNKARGALTGLIGKELHQLNLTTEQIEHLAKAWAEVKAMTPENPDKG